MAVDDLSTPLGMDLGQKASKKRRIKLAPVFLVLTSLLTLGVGAFVLFTHDPLGGEPYAVSAITRPAPASTTNTTLATKADAAPQNPPARSTAAEIEEESGVKVVRQNGAGAPSAVIIRVPDEQVQTRLASAPDKRVAEKSRHGLLPKIGIDGQRPFDIYARALNPSARAKTARIAIVVGGLGIGASVTNDAVTKLPGEVSLAFAPYGNDLERQVQNARNAGHEVLLHLPMEPFDYPDNDPGPQTLLSSLTPTQNVDRLQWLMSRFTGYVGVMNFMGARLTANEEAVQPILREVASRGLAYLDDGSSPRSRAIGIANAAGLPAARGDLIIDMVQKGSEIDASLAKLEAIARERGVAVGVASALPVTLERIARWSKTLEARGIALVPVSSTVVVPRT